jgi:uncharacterized protein involved in oxidation of intracellular sulfur
MEGGVRVNKCLLILNDPPYGTERSYNGLRLAASLVKQENTEVRVFLIGDSVACAKRGQTLPQGYYNLERMLQAVAQRGGEIGVCGSCIDARGIAEGELVDGCRRSNMEELTSWSLWADRLLVF